MDRNEYHKQYMREYMKKYRAGQKIERIDETKRLLLDLTLGRAETDMYLLREYWHQLLVPQRRKVVDMIYNSYLHAERELIHMQLNDNHELKERMAKLYAEMDETAKELDMIGKPSIWTKMFGPKKYEVMGGYNQNYVQHMVTSLSNDELVAVAKYFGSDDLEIERIHGSRYDLFQLVIKHTMQSIVKQWAFGNYLDTRQLK